MMAGIFVAAAPVAILAVGGYGLVARRNKAKLVQQKELLLQHATAKRDAIIRELDGTAKDQAGRVEYLSAINIKLQDVIKNLRQDLQR